MAESDLQLAYPDLLPSPPQWLAAVRADFAAFLRDHASCEKKASGMAMSVASHYPDQPRLLAAMVDLAVEELSHYREVVKLMLARDLYPGADTKDPYVHQLNQHIRRGPENFLLDRLLAGAVIERRGAERFAMIAASFADQADGAEAQQMQAFYQAIAASEDKHWLLFVRLAVEHCESDAVAARLLEFCAIEEQIMLSLPPRAALH